MKNNQFYLKNSKLFIILLLISFGNAYGQAYQWISYPGNMKLTLTSDSTYYFFYHRTLLSIDDTLEHYGRYDKNNDTLIFNSYIQPNAKDLYECTEYQTNSDSITIIFIPEEGMFSFMLPQFIRINNFDNFILTKGDSSVFRIKKTEINWIIFGTTYTSFYPTYYPRDSNSDYFRFIVTDMAEDSRPWFPMYSYFYKEMYLNRNDSLIPIENNKLNTDHALILVQ